MKHDHSSFVGFGRSNAAAAYSAAQAGYTRSPDEILKSYMPMVRRLAWHLNGTGHDTIEIEDLMQSGLMALSDCIRRHEGPTEDGFAAYAKTRVKGAMIDLIRREAPMSRTAARKRREMAEQENALQRTLGRKPTGSELASLLGISEIDLTSAQTASAPMRFEPIDDHYSDTSLAFADRSPDSLAILEDNETSAQLAAALAALPERLQMITQLYFVEELNLAEIAKTLDLSIPRVHQLKAQALDQLRKQLGGSVDFI